MPIFDQGYQHWQGQLTGHAWRWLTITLHGVRAQFRNRWTRIALFVAMSPAFALAAVLVLWGLIEQQSEVIRPLLNILRLPPEIAGDPKAFRAAIWTLSYYFFFRVETFFAMIVVLLVGPNLISQDLRFNAMPLYFSRPLRRFDYFMGKLGIIGFFLGAVVIVPAVIAHLLGFFFSLDFGVLMDTGRLLGASIAYGLVIVLSAGMLMLAISSLSRKSLYVALMWFGLWLISAHLALALGGTVRGEWCPLVSYTGNLQRVGGALLDTRSAWQRLDDLAQAAQHKVQAQMGNFGRTDAMGPHMPAPGAQQPQPPLPGGQQPMQQPPQMRTQPVGPRLTEFAGDAYPWSWSAGVLAGLFGLSLWILTSRVKSLDRLK
jgi:ABC-2 type transport system permease protein